MRWIGMAGALAAALCGVASAQDMTFGVSETTPDAFPVGASQPSAVLVRALDHYDAERFPQAAVMLQQVVEGATGDGDGGRQQAQFYLSKALVHLGFDHSALALIDEVTRDGRGHAYFVQVLPWLARLAQRMPQSDAVLDVAGRFAGTDLPRVGDALGREARARVQLAMAEHAYRERDLEQAVARFAAVDDESSLKLRARFLEGVAQVRRRRAQPAIRAFRDVVKRVDDGRTHGAEEAERLRALAWLSLGRVYYTAAHGAGGRRAEGALVGNAVHAWQQVEQDSEYWLDALFESAWALFVSDEHARALGNLHALLSPYFAGAFYPEAHLLQAVIFFNSCQMDNSMAALERFHERYDPLRNELRVKLERGEPDGAGASSPALAALLTSAQGDRESLRAREEFERVAQEQQLLARAPEALRRSSLGERIQQDLAVARAFAETSTRELAQARTRRLLDELQEVANQADTVEIEILNYSRGRLGKQPTVPAAKGSSVHVDSEHVLWPFNGEYWRDELGYYRQEVPNHCSPR